MRERLRLYGTDVPPVATERITVGQLSFTLEDGALRHISVDGTEIIRGIAFLVRDRDWGTLVPRLSVVSRAEQAGTFSMHLKAVFETEGATLDVSLIVDVGPHRVAMRAEGLSTGEFETNRTGFTVLHPAALAGCPVSIAHSDGTVEASAFPTLIDPWQPFMDITAMTHRAEGLAVRCAFEGDIFETEDQRQWGDASYKTYVRPLALPWPYVLADGVPFSQSVSVDWEQAETSPPLAEEGGAPGEVLFPDTAILLRAQDAKRLAEHPEDLAHVSPQRLLCHLDTTTDGVPDQIAAFARLQAAMPDLIYDLELVCGFDLAPDAELAQVRAAMESAGFRPASVLVCPSVDRQSTPPGSDWPACPPLEDIHRASAQVFGDIAQGGGMVTFFPELNRKRPPVEMLDFVAHSLCPIVHAADDLSVMETLHTIPHITRSARAIIGDKEYRIGPSTIAMRHNPYGQRTMSNPGLGRVCMTDDDPRHRAAFGGAFVIGMACALAPSGVAVWTPSELYGPRGLSGPLGAAVSVLASCAGEPVHKADLSEGCADLIIGERRIIANLTDSLRDGLGPYAFAVSRVK